MNLGFEHDSIREALARAGLLRKDPPRDMLLSERSPGPFSSAYVAWSSKEELLLSPEHAWLSLEDVGFYRLPQPLAVLRKIIEDAHRPKSPPPAAAALSSPLGQWRWAIEDGSRALEEGRFGELPKRLAHLRRFALGHWPGWYEHPLAHFEEKYLAGEASPAELRALVEHAATVAALKACDPLMRWTQGPDAERIKLLRDAACYAAQGLINVGEVTELLGGDRWGQEMSADLEALKAAVSRAGPDDAVGQRLRECLGSIEQSLKDGELLAGADGVGLLKGAEHCQQSLASLVRALENIRALRERTQSLLNSGR